MARSDCAAAEQRAQQLEVEMQALREDCGTATQALQRELSDASRELNDALARIRSLERCASRRL